MPPTTLKTKKLFVCSIALITTCLGSGFLWGRASVQPIETELLAPLSLRNFRQEKLKEVCYRNPAVAGFLSSDDRRSWRNVLDVEVSAIPFSDRGMVCKLVGTLGIAEVNASGDLKNYRKEPFSLSVLFAITGEAEIINSELATALPQSRAVSAMASNEGNDGTIVEKMRIKPLGLIDRVKVLFR